MRRGRCQCRRRRRRRVNIDCDSPLPPSHTHVARASGNGDESWMPDKKKGRGETKKGGKMRWRERGTGICSQPSTGVTMGASVLYALPLLLAGSFIQVDGGQAAEYRFTWTTHCYGGTIYIHRQFTTREGTTRRLLFLLTVLVRSRQATKRKRWPLLERDPCLWT